MAARVALALLGLAAGASALQSVPAPGVPCSTVSPGSPGFALCDPALQPYDYYSAMKAGALSLTVLGAETNGGCDYIEDAFEETFTSPTLNFTRWLPEELDGQEHCIGALPRSVSVSVSFVCAPTSWFGG